MRVIIIGAGLGGLCLAQGLRNEGFDVAVYERSARDGAQPPSYGIHLNADGLRALHNCLPQANWDQFTASTVPASNVINFHDPRRGLLASLDFRTPERATDPITSRRAVTRGHLREALLLGTNPPPTGPSGAAAPDGSDRPDSSSDSSFVRWGKRFHGYARTADHRIQVTFEDGTSTIGDLLVGADGSNSAVRRQRLPGLQRQDLGILNVAGRVPLTRELAEVLPPQLCDTSINNIVPAGAGWMFASTWATGDSSGRAIPGAERTDRYLIWAWAARRDTYPAEGAGLSPEELKSHVQLQIRRWSPALKHLVASTDPADVGPVPLRSMPLLPDWEPDNVTLLGDAIHNMTPMGGIGANTALRDADTLRAALIAQRDMLAAAFPWSAEAVVAAVREYEARMRTYANAALTLSTRNAQRATNPARLPRSIFRTLLRAAGRSNRIQERVFHTPPPDALARTAQAGQVPERARRGA